MNVLIRGGVALCFLLGSGCTVARLETVIKMPPRATAETDGFLGDDKAVKDLCNRLLVYVVEGDVSLTAPPTQFKGKTIAAGEYLQDKQCVWGLPVDPGTYSLFVKYDGISFGKAITESGGVTTLPNPSLTSGELCVVGSKSGLVVQQGQATKTELTLSRQATCGAIKAPPGT